MVIQGDLTDDLAWALLSVDRIARDIETTGLDWATSRIGTCQLFSDRTGPVLVQVGDRRPDRLASLLADSRVIKVFHHAPFDLRFMTHHWGVQPAGIRCTKVASRLLHPDNEEGHSLKDLLGLYIGVELDKTLRVSDWSAQQLTDAQVNYAVSDVTHLLQLVDLLTKELHNEGLADLYDDCCRFLPTRVRLELGNWPDVFAY